MSPERLPSHKETKKSVISADVVVFEPTATGVMAAVAAAREGASVAVVGRSKHVGGMVSGGLSWTDVGETNVIKGLTRQFYQEVANHYKRPLWEVKGPEPHVAEKILLKQLEQSGVGVYLGEELENVSTKDNRIQSIRTDKATYHASVFIDASYEGDVMAGAGVRYAVGRESKAQYGEALAGVKPATRPNKHNFITPHAITILDPFTADRTSLLPFISEPKQFDYPGLPAHRIGEADDALQAYAFRVVMTDKSSNKIPFTQPDGYTPEKFELLDRYLHARGKDLHAQDLMGLVPDLLPNGKCDVNSIGPFSLNLLDGSNKKYPDGDKRMRKDIRDNHLHYTQSFLYYLANEKSVPKHIRKEMNKWGLCADEFTDTKGWPHQLYVREGRRMKGEHVLVEQDLMYARQQSDVISLGSYNIDLREAVRVAEYWPNFGTEYAALNEGYASLRVPAYEIPYRTLTPKKEENENLLVPVCSSTSHVAFGSVRMEPTMMQLGEAAGIAAAQAAQRGKAVQDVDIRAVQQILFDPR